MFAQDSTLIGDVDCSGEVNSQDASLILQFVTNVIDELPCEANMIGLTPDQLQEIINMMEDQLSINYTAGSGGGCNYRFPDGLDGEPIFIELSGSETYSPPSGKRLYVFRVTDSGITVNNILVSSPSHSPIILNSDDELGIYQQTVSLNYQGVLLNENQNIEAISLELSGNETYIVPNGQRLYALSIDGLIPSVNGVQAEKPIDNPLILSNEHTLGVFGGSGSLRLNGYLADEDYFADCSGGGGSTINSVAETGSGMGFNFAFPDGYHNISPIVIDLLNDSYVVPEGKNLHISSAYAKGWGGSVPIITVNNREVFQVSSDYIYESARIPYILKSGDVLDFDVESVDVINLSGYLVDEDYFSSAGSEFSSVENYVLLNSNQYSFTASFDSSFSVSFQLTDNTILDSYLYKGLTCNLYDNSNQLLNSTGVFNHPATATNWDFGSSVLDEQSGQLVSVHIVFMSSLGMIVVDELLNFPE